MDDTPAILIMATAPVWAALSAAVAHEKRRSVAGWAFWGLLIGVFALLLVAIAPPDRTRCAACRQPVEARAGCNHFTPHAFRRGFARHTRRAGLDLGEVAALMGHATLTMTMRYSQAGEAEAARDAYRRLIG